MIILPAIDIKDRTCVRLYQGAFDTVEKVAEDPLETARTFAAAGATWLHMVDLDGALQGKAVNADIFKTIARETPLRVELGGGIRDMDRIEDYLESGIARVILGSVAIEKPALVKEAVARYGERIAVGIDARDGYARGGGWTEASDIHYLELARAMRDAGVRTIIYTDIACDGTLGGANVAHYQALLEAVPEVEIIASGGVRDIDDIKALRGIGVAGVICGKSLYAGTLDLKEALAVAQQED